METSSQKPTNLALKWAVIYVVASIVLTYAWQFLGVDPNGSTKYIGYIPFIAFLLLTQKEFKDQLGGFMTFGQGFLSGFIYSVFAGIMLAVFMYIYLGILSPQVLEQAVASQHDKMVAQGLTEGQIDNATSIAKKYGAIIGAVTAIIGTPIMGAIIALIGAAIFKKEPTLLDIEKANETATPVE